MQTRNNNQKPTKWRVRTLPGSTIKVGLSEKGARKELERIAEMVYLDVKLNRNMLLILRVVTEYFDKDKWIVAENLHKDELIALHESSLV